MGTLVVYPNHTTAGEGFTWRDTPGTWSSIISGSGTGAITRDTFSGSIIRLYLLQCNNVTDQFYQCQRGIFLFDTSSLSSAATITSATFGAFVTNKFNNFTGFPVNDNVAVNIFSTNPSSNTSFVASDYGTYGSTQFSNSSYSYNSFANDTAFSITLNSTGLSNISKTGITKFGTRENYYDALANSLYWQDSCYILTNVYSNFGDPTYSPKLTITFTGDPTVTTQAVSSVTATSLVGNGNITDVGGASVTRRGFCYMVGTSGDPTTANSVAYDDGTFSTGAYTKSITGLTESTNYRVRAYAVNSVGTAYGSTVQATTPSATSVKTFDGVARASVKTFDGVASASIKTFNGIA